MTPFLAALIPVAFVAGWWARIRYDTHRHEPGHWQTAELETPRPRPPDPNLRLASISAENRRVDIRVDVRTRELREAVGDLLDTVKERDQTIDALARRSPIPTYGPRHRITR